MQKSHLKLSLISRGEAHVTVITPIEFHPHLATRLSMDEKYSPHITIGFTKRDLHESDGVMKDERSIDKRFKIKKR